MIIPEAQVFLEKIVTEKHGSVSAEFRRDTIASLQSRLEAHVMTALAAAMPPAGVAAMNELVGDTTEITPEKIQSIITQHIPNISEIVAAALLEFRATYLAS